MKRGLKFKKHLTYLFFSSMIKRKKEMIEMSKKEINLEELVKRQKEELKKAKEQDFQNKFGEGINALKKTYRKYTAEDIQEVNNFLKNKAEKVLEREKVEETKEEENKQ